MKQREEKVDSVQQEDKMKVAVYLSEDKMILMGEAPIFGVDYLKGADTRLRDIGFWLENWRYEGHSGAAHKGRVFIPWCSTLYIMEEEK